MTQTTIHTIETAPEASKAILRRVHNKFGFIPNLLGVLAEAPSALEAYISVAEAFSKSSLSAAEQQIVLISASIENSCHYCVAAHTFLARGAGVPSELLEALRAGRPLKERKLNTLAVFTRNLVVQRGRVSLAAQEAFREAGYGAQQLQEVLVGITQKTLSNYSNHLSQLEVDAQFTKDVWEPESVAAE